MPVGTAYAAWVGIGTVGVAVVGMAALGEPVSRGRVAGLAAVVAGVAGLNLVGG
ncbi:DMT family transporter [Nocardiopsis chromatogenes]|uniref:DMT family transporter n=1 Tax=Nocardiopsis chromatogenes TaxID=280239 RepID=UPI0023AA1AAD|nr:SMR family transporter [Nocardiopsis chromatogenes]